MSDVNKLKDILSRSKAIMQKTEQNYGTTSNSTQSFGISEGEEKDIPNLTEDYISKNNNRYEEQPKPVSRPQKTNNISIDEKTIKKIVKEEMENVVRSVIEEYLDKSLVTEDIQIRVGGTTFSGKLKPLPQKRK